MAEDLDKSVVFAEHAGGHRVRLRFEDGVEGEVDLAHVVRGFRGVLAPLAEPSYVAKVAVTEYGTIGRPNGAELDPIVLYCAARGVPVPDFEKSSRSARRRRSGQKTTRSRSNSRGRVGGKRRRSRKRSRRP